MSSCYVRLLKNVIFLVYNTSGHRTVFLYTDRPKQMNNVFTFSAIFFSFSKTEHCKLVCEKSFYALYAALSQLKFNLKLEKLLRSQISEKK